MIYINWAYLTVLLLAVPLSLLLAWCVSYGYFERQALARAVRHWLKPPHAQPIYGGSDPQRTNGPGSKPNLKLVRS